MAPSSVARGWRYWHVDAHLRLGSPVSLKSETSSHDVWDGSAQRVARCRHHEHHAPDPNCGCGYRVCEAQVSVLVELVKDRPSSSLIRPERCPRLVILRVEGSGRIEPGARDDPEGTWRCERLAIVGAGYASPSLTQRDLDLLRERYGVGFWPARRGTSLLEWCIELNGGAPLRESLR